MSPMEENVDVILPTHRRPHTIAYAIQSVLRQTYPHLQLHVVGDGCDEATESVVRSFQDPRVHFYGFPKAIGFGYAHRNEVLRQHSGRYIAYATDDDLWFPDHLERGLAELQGRSLELVAFRSCHVQFPDTLDLHFFAFDWQRAFPANFMRNWFMGAVVIVHRRRVFDKVGYWNDKLFRFGDREFYNRVRVSGIPCAYVDYITVLRFYAQHWDERYTLLKEPPQKRYIARLQDPEWCSTVRHAAASGARSLAARRNQWRDFLLFGVRSGPKFLRFWYQQMTTQPPK